MIRPALTPEEWATFPSWPDAPRPMFNGDAPLYYPTKHGIAAANLHGLVVDGKPVGFTREHVRMLMEDIELYDDSSPSAQRVYKAITSLADIIEALLPPLAPPVDPP